MKADVLVLLWLVFAGVGCEKSSPPDATAPMAGDTARATPSAQYETQLGYFDCDAYSPLDFLQYLQLKQQELPDGAIGSVAIFPGPSWIKEEHLTSLADSLDSRALCIHVASIAASTIPRQPSTVGQEAAFLMEGFRQGKYPPALVSDSVDIADVRTWWNEYARRHP